MNQNNQTIEKENGQEKQSLTENRVKGKEKIDETQEEEQKSKGFIGKLKNKLGKFFERFTLPPHYPYNQFRMY